MASAEKLLKDMEETLVQQVEAVVYERNEFILQAGAVEQHFYWIEKGAVRAFYLSEMEEHTIRLGYQGSLISSLSSFLTGAPSELYLQAIRKTELRMIPKALYRQFVEETPERLLQYSRLLELLFAQQLEREIDLLTYSPVERYQRVLARSPQLFQEIPAKYIASYLRMTPETLSRIQKS